MLRRKIREICTLAGTVPLEERRDLVVLRAKCVFISHNSHGSANVLCTHLDDVLMLDELEKEIPLAVW